MAWNNSGNLTGPEGAASTVPGPTGPQGPQGPAGAPTPPSTLAYSTSITPNATASNSFYVAATGSFTLNPPTSPTSGQMLMVEVRASAAVTVTIAAAIRLTTGQTATLAVVSDKSGFIGLRYSSTAAAWYLLAASAQV